MSRRLVLLLLVAIGASVVAQPLPPTETAATEAAEANARVVDYRAYGDGGTLGLLLRRPDEPELLVCVSQDAFETAVPHNTLFLGAWHPSGDSARLPKDDAEVERVVSLLREAAAEGFSAEELEAALDRGRWPEDHWERGAAAIALTVLKRLRAKGRHDVYDPASGAPPAWYAAYDEDRQRRLAEARREAEIDRQFLELYPAEAQEALTVSFSEEGDWSPEGHDRQVRDRGRRVAKAVDDPVRLAEITCRALGLIGGDWRAHDTRDLIAMRAMKRIRGADFAKALDLLDDDVALLGAGRVMFQMGFADKLDDPAWAKHVPRVAKRLLTDPELQYPPAIVMAIGKRELPEATELLRNVASGEVAPTRRHPKADSEEPGLAACAYLALGRRGDVAVALAAREALAAATNPPDRAALEVTLALLGEPERLRADHFRFLSYAIGLSALDAIDRAEGRAGVDVLFMGGLDHRYGAVADRAIKLAQKLTGQRWVPFWSNRQPSSYRDEAKAWWAENGESFLAKQAHEGE